jgi:hypothetical protein
VNVEMMTLDQPPHHVGLARRTKSRADLLGLLHLDQAIDDVAARHQQPVNLLVDRVDLFAQQRQRGRGGGWFGHFRTQQRCPRPLESGACAASRRMMMARSVSWCGTAQGRPLTTKSPG